jgi:hypothetical protein
MGRLQRLFGQQGLHQRLFRPSPAEPANSEAPSAVVQPSKRRQRLSPMAPDQSLPYSWILTNRLALGPMPTSLLHWQQLEQAGLQSRFSCCYAEEETWEPIPSHWQSSGVSLPDHRRQEPLRHERLAEALAVAGALLAEDKPVYLHCMAGIERSPLVAIGLTARERNLDMHAALDWVRRCHPAASPIYDHLELLDQVLRG